MRHRGLLIPKAVNCGVSRRDKEQLRTAQTLQQRMRQIGTAWRAWRGSAAGLTILGRHHLSPQHTAAPRSFITLSRLPSVRRLKAMQFQTLAHRLLQLTQLRTVPGLSLRYIQQSPSEQLKAVAGLQQLGYSMSCLRHCLERMAALMVAWTMMALPTTPGAPWWEASAQASRGAQSLHSILHSTAC